MLSLPMAKGAQELFGRKTGKALLPPYQATDDSFFVSNEVCDSREQARLEICRVFRQLQFIEATGLLPAQDFVAQRSLPTLPNRLKDPGSPFHHHLSYWAAPGNNRAVVLLERYFSPGKLQQDENMRWSDSLAWVANQRCQATPFSWTGMLDPESGSRVMAIVLNDARYDLADLRGRVDQLDEQLTPSNWENLVSLAKREANRQ
jgi:hypothetical protein